MAKATAIGLEKSYSEKLAEKLNSLLAHYSLFYQNTRGFHWNIKGDKFFELHVKFEELYNDLLLKVDEVAERILTLGHTPQHNYSEYIKQSTIKETKTISDGVSAVKHILDSFKVIITLQRDILKDSESEADEGTNSMMSDYIKSQEKLVWMYGSFLGK